jgi:benzoyl-CoA reductase subunit D
LALASQRIRRRVVDEVVTASFEEACQTAGVAPGDFDYIASTGDGDAVHMRTGHFYGMTTHARGALWLEPNARGVLDVGALHARALKIDDRGKVLGHRMTSQCASGSGQFLENIARYLGVPLEDVGAISCQSTNAEPVSSICAVLAETDVINMVSRGLATADILRGIHLSIAGRLVKLIKSAGADGTILVTGGLAADEGLYASIVQCMSEGVQKKTLVRNLGMEVKRHENAMYAGAIGAALLAAYRWEQLAKSGRLEMLLATA